ncbi:MAG: hypothetical protein WCP03_03290 [Candidatus Saccharibacteria bacterium]
MVYSEKYSPPERFRDALDDTTREEWQKKEEETKARLQQIIEESPDKEPFDYGKFANLYWKQDADIDMDGSEPESVQNDFLSNYYMAHKDVKTIEEYAKKLKELDSVSGN